MRLISCTFIMNVSAIQAPRNEPTGVMPAFAIQEGPDRLVHAKKGALAGARRTASSQSLSEQY
jgi:hypothetical protein